MADLAPLEKMGRELKCPICLSLLKSAVSLPCNHVFCNSCVMESMKSVSDCPVCKVPFRRREVRPAPHMDNLVTVFKSMETAAGVNIFTTQVEASTKQTGDDEKSSGMHETTGTRRGRTKRKRSVSKARQKLKMSDVEAHDSSQPSQPSFPANKRVHVTPYPVPETPVPPKRASKLANTGEELNIKSLKEDGRAADNQEDTLFSPFFWLREKPNDDEDDDEVSVRPSGQLTPDASQSNVAPCFSDLKDSEDDRSPIKMTATNQFNAADAFDSEIFEWTQRACSPELCSTPVKKQTGTSNKLDVIQETVSLKQTEMESADKVPHDKFAKRSRVGDTSMEDQGTGALLLKGGGLKGKKRITGNRRGKHLKNCSRKVQVSSLGEVHHEDVDDTIQRVENSSDEDKDADTKELSSHGRRISKRVKISDKVRQKKDYAATDEAPAQLPSSSTGQKIQNKEVGVGIVQPDMAPNDTKLDTQTRPDRRGKQDILQAKKKPLMLLRDNGESNPISYAVETDTQNQECQKAVATLQVFSSNRVENAEISGKGCLKNCTVIQNKVMSESKQKRKRKTQTADFERNSNGDEIHVSSPESNGCKSNQPGSSVASRNNGDKILRKSEVAIQFKCAFCQGTVDTEDSGEIMHYFNGKPVAADYNGGVNLIHSHKHCTEWAPNVFFEDDLAVNLAAELARSRRIKCSCCGIKGAALGCYERSCRKSFHFPCAKLIPECRWDNDNFVILCPLHATSNLPSEIAEPQRQRRKCPNPKGELKVPINCKNGHDPRPKWTWPSGSPCKWVLCCSALTAAEKDIISEFTKLTSIPVSKSWNPTVTHVIASTDENGACKRTLKYLMGILDGKWILNIEWIKACLKAMEPVDEYNFEVKVDVYGIAGGPRMGRLRASNKEPKLLSRFKFYLAGEFAPNYKGYLQDLIMAAGGTVLHRKPLTKDQEKLFHDSSAPETFIIYSVEPLKTPECKKGLGFGRRRAEAQAVADSCEAKVAASSWIMDSIAASKLQQLSDCS